MVFKMLRKLLDPNYATKKVDAVREDANKDLRKASRSAGRLEAAAKNGDVTMVLFVAAGGKK